MKGIVQPTRKKVVSIGLLMPLLLLVAACTIWPSPGRVVSDTFTEYDMPTSGNVSELTTGPDRNVWFTEEGGNKIGWITHTGKITEYTVPTNNSFPEGITAGSDGNLWFTEGEQNKIGRITTQGVVTEFSYPSNAGTGEHIITGPDGNLWFNEHIYGNPDRIAWWSVQK